MIMAFNKRIHIIENTEAIRCAFEILKQGRPADEDQIITLNKFSGFGGLKCFLNPLDKLESWPDHEKDLFPFVTELLNVIKANVSDNLYPSYIKSIRNNTLTGFYTPPQIIDVLSKTLKEDGGINSINFLDPSAGMGSFLNSFSKLNPNMKGTAFEKDLITGLILKTGYQSATVRIEPYEEAGISLNRTFDVIASNIPFGDFNAWDSGFVNSKDKNKQLSCRAIHNYYFAKSIDLIKEGGVIGFITSDGVMNSSSNEFIRQYMMKNCNLVSAVRLPSNTFTDYAGTSAGSDLIILQKVPTKSGTTIQEKLFLKSNKTDIGNFNEYYQDLKHVVHTKRFIDTDQYGKPSHVFEHEGGINGIAMDLATILRSDISRNINLKLFETTQPRISNNTGLFVQGDLFSQNQDSLLKAAPYNGPFGKQMYNGQVVVQDNKVGIIQSIDLDFLKATFQPKLIRNDQ